MELNNKIKNWLSIIGFIAFIYITIHVTLLINNKQHNNIISNIELEKKHPKLKEIV